MNFPKAQFVLTLISLDPLGFKVSVSETVTFRKRLELSPSLNVKCFSSSPEGHSGSNRGQVSRDLGSAFRASPRGAGQLYLLHRLHPSRAVMRTAACTPGGRGCPVLGGARCRGLTWPYPPDPLSSGWGAGGLLLRVCKWQSCSCANSFSKLVYTGICYLTTTTTKGVSA